MSHHYHFGYASFLVAVLILVNLDIILCKSCLGPPYLYITTHDEVPNVMKYSRDGCLLEVNVLKGGPIDNKDHNVELRSIVLGSYNGSDNFLYVADAMTHESFVTVYGTCDKNGQRPFITTVVNSFINPGADHAYGLTFDTDGNIYASFQHTDAVLRFHKDSFEPLPLPLSLSQYHKWKEFYPGTFVQFGAPGPHPTREQGVRSIILVKDNLWIANKDLNGIAIASIRTGMIHNIVVVKNAIGLHYDPVLNLVFAGSKQKHWQGVVYAIDPKAMRIKRKYRTHRMNHPSGLVTYGNILFVAELSQGKVFTFDVHSTKLLDTIIDHAPGEIEQLTLSPC